MGLDAMLVDEPIQTFSAEPVGTVPTGGVRDKDRSDQAKTFYHAFCGQDLGLPDRGCRFDNGNDDRVVDVDQISWWNKQKKSLARLGYGPYRRRIGR